MKRFDKNYVYITKRNRKKQKKGEQTNEKERKKKAINREGDGMLLVSLGVMTQKTLKNCRGAK